MKLTQELKDKIKHQLSQYNPDELYDMLVERYEFKQEDKKHESRRRKNSS